MHRPSISTDFSLSLEFGSLLNNNKKNEENDNERNLKASKNKLIKVNTKRNNFSKILSLRNQNKTNKKFDKNKQTNDIENNELFKNVSEINIFKSKNSKKENNEAYNINKVIYIQKWWKNILFVNNREFYSILFFIKHIKRIFLKEIYMLIRYNFPSFNYYFYKWNNIINKRKIIKQIIKNANKIKKINITKNRYSTNSRISPRKSLGKENQEKKNAKKFNKNSQNSKKKFISIASNNNNSNENNSKLKDKNNYCQTTKHDIINKINYINLDINKHKKKAIPYSPKSNINSERHNSPLTILTKISQINNSSFSKKSKKNISRIVLKKEKKNKNSDKKSNKKKTKTVINRIKKNKNNKGKNLIEQKINSKLDKIISHNNSISKKEIPSTTYEDNSSLSKNPNSKFNNYMLNLSRKEINLTPYCKNYSKGEKNENNINNDDNYNLLIYKNNNSQYNTESSCSKINSIFKGNNNSKSNSKVYENCLYKDCKYKNLSLKDKNEIFTKMSKNENKIVKNKNNIPINKHVVFHKKEKEKISLNKEFSNHKKNIDYNLLISNINIPLSEANSTLSKVSSIENNSNNRRKLKNSKNKKIRIGIYFNFWKEYTNKKIILKKLIHFSKLVVNHFNHYQNIILLKNSIQKLVKINKNENFLVFIDKLIYKMIVKILTTIYEYKKYNMKEIKIFKKNNCNNILTNLQRGKGDIINNININNYIHYDDYHLLQKRKARSPDLISKVIEFRTTNNNPYYDNNKQNKNIDNIEEHISLPINEEAQNIIKINKEIQKKNTIGYLNNRILQINTQKDTNGVIIDQINQLKMVFNLLERHNFNNKKKESILLLDCFNKWKFYSLNKTKDFDKKIATPRISEKIINLKPFQTSNIINNVFEPNQIDISLKKNFSISKMSPKIINVINVQNFNENNNYNYNFKYMPIKDIPIYPLKSRHSYAYTNLDNYENINTEINNNSNKIFNGNEINNNNNNSGSLMLLNENRQIGSKIVYHKKKLTPMHINNNYNFNFNNNSNFNNYYCKIDKNLTMNDNSSCLVYDQNQSDILFSKYNTGIFSIDKNNSLNMAQTVFRDNSSKNIRTFTSRPEEKFGFKKLNKIEEKEINFENVNSKKLYIKKQHFEGKKGIFNQINLKSNIDIKDEIICNNNLIKCLNIQFGKTSKELNKKDKINNNINESKKGITINEDNFDKNKSEDEKGQVSLKNKTYKNIYNKITINFGNKEYYNNHLELSNKLNKLISSRIKDEDNDKINFSYSFGVDQTILKEFQLSTKKSYFLTI